MDRRTFLHSATMAGACAVAQKLVMAQEPGTKSQTIRIHSAEAGPLPHVWEECVGSDRAVVGMREQWLNDLALVRKTTGMKSVRFHGLFNDEMGVWPSGLTERLSRTKAWPACLPVKSTQREGAQTAFPQ